MLCAVSVIANGGYLVEPRVVRRILSPDGQLIAAPEVVRRRVISEETARQMREAMSHTVEHGTGSRARLAGFSGGGKTGTAQKFVGGGYSKTKYVASYIGFAPIEKPVLASIVVVNEPVGDYYGGLVAAPVFKEVMERALIKMGVLRDRPDSVQKASYHPQREPESIRGVSEKRYLSMERLPETVAALVGKGLGGLSEDTVVTQVTDGFDLPDFEGLSLREVAMVSARYGLTLSYTGEGRVVGQRPAPRTLVSSGTVCEVVLSEEEGREVATRRTRRSTSTQIVSGGRGARLEN
jgi:membrane peptidoglycan carboxypeptidase